MIEYTLSVDNQTKILINPKYIQSVRNNGNTMCSISLTDGSIYVVLSSYDEVKKQLQEVQY